MRSWLFDGARIEVGQLPIEAPAAPAVQAWIKVADVWKEGTVWIKVAGTWQTAAPRINVGGVWQ